MESPEANKELLSIILVFVFFLALYLISKSGYLAELKSEVGIKPKYPMKVDEKVGLDLDGSSIKFANQQKVDDLTRGIILISFFNIGAHFLPLIDFIRVARVYHADWGKISLFLAVLCLGVAFSKNKKIIKPTVILASIVQLAILLTIFIKFGNSKGSWLELQSGPYVVFGLSLINLILGILIKNNRKMSLIDTINDNFTDYVEPDMGKEEVIEKQATIFKTPDQYDKYATFENKDKEIVHKPIQVEIIKGEVAENQEFDVTKQSEMDDPTKGIILISILCFGAHFLPAINVFRSIKVYEVDGGIISLLLSILTLGIVFTKNRKIIKPTVIFSSAFQLMILLSIVGNFKQDFGGFVKLEIGIFVAIILSALNLLLGILVGKIKP